MTMVADHNSVVRRRILPKKWE